MEYELLSKIKSPDDVKKLKKDSLISEDEEKKYNNDIQKWTDDAIRKVDEQVALKEKDIMQV